MIKKVLSIQQPWAWLIVKGMKPIENRTWWTSHRGELFIHAGKKFDAEGYEWIRENFKEIGLPPKNEFECGGIIGKVEMTDCVKEYESKWFFGPFGFVFTNAQQLPFIKMPGQLGIFGIADTFNGI